MWQEKNAAAERKQNMRYGDIPPSLTDSLRSVVQLRRAVPAYGGAEVSGKMRGRKRGSEGRGEAVFP